MLFMEMPRKLRVWPQIYQINTIVIPGSSGQGVGKWMDFWFISPHQRNLRRLPIVPFAICTSSWTTGNNYTVTPWYIWLTSRLLTEKISIYADETLLYLADSGASLSTAVTLIEQFGLFSGLKINWDKSQILPLDSFVEANLRLQRVNRIKYLGVQVTNSSAEYTPNNIQPLMIW